MVPLVLLKAERKFLNFSFHFDDDKLVGILDASQRQDHVPYKFILAVIGGADIITVTRVVLSSQSRIFQKREVYVFHD